MRVADFFFLSLDFEFTLRKCDAILFLCHVIWLRGCALSVSQTCMPGASKGLCETNLMQLNFELRIVQRYSTREKNLEIDRVTHLKIDLHKSICWRSVKKYKSYISWICVIAVGHVSNFYIILPKNNFRHTISQNVKSYDKYLNILYE